VNTLKPLLMAAVLAGIGYGVYIRLNAGSNAPPPPVDPGWNSAPSIQLPDQAGAAPWAHPGAPTEVAPGGPAVAIPGGEAPAYQPPAVAAGEAPPYGQTPVESSVPMPPPAGAAPPYQQDLAQTDPSQAPADAGAPSGPANPYDYLPPQDASAPPGAGPDAGAPPAGSAPPADPYSDPYGAPAAAPPAGSEQPTGDAPPYGGATETAPPAAGGDFAAALDAAHRDLESGQMAEALRELTGWYGNPQLTADQQQQLNALLDQVAGTVVYSTQNVLEPPYEVQPGERLETIGEKYQVPWQLLAKINGIDDPAALQPGERLKVIRGPFQAVVSIDRRELILMTADNLYAGRFRVGLGAEHPPQEGTFAVSEKVENPVYYGRERAIGAEDPSNPLGERWIGLGNSMSIHGTNNPENIGRNDLPGSISLSERDAADVYDILGLGSRVTVRR